MYGNPSLRATFISAAAASKHNAPLSTTHGPAMTTNDLPDASCFQSLATDSDTRVFYWSERWKQSFVLPFASRMKGLPQRTQRDSEARSELCASVANLSSGYLRRGSRGFTKRHLRHLMLRCDFVEERNDHLL